MNTSYPQPETPPGPDRQDKTKKVERWLRNIAVWSFGISSLAFTQVGNQDDSLIAKACAAILPLGYLVAFVTLICLAFYHFHKNQHGQSLLGSAWLAMRRTFLYILLPAILLTGALVLWGILTHQPAFRGEW